jgi:prevent-host-death family protein
MPISEAREHLTDVVNRAVYAGESTYITRRGKRLAIVMSPAQLAADQARAEQQAVLRTCRLLWQSAASANDTTRAIIRELIDKTIEDAEDTADTAVVAASDEDRIIGTVPIPWSKVKADLEL